MLKWLAVIVTVAIPGLIGAETAYPSDAATPIPEAYPDAPAFTVQPRASKLEFQPCSRCHEEGDTDPEPRRLRTRHAREIDHGGNRFWCLTCHNADNRDFLHTSRHEKIGFDQSYLICGSCHANRQRDWYFGGHGKRVSGWQGKRVILPCTQCHDPHAPAMEPREPKPPPPVRVGLERQEHHRPEPKRVWER